jgi:hypothetical protein
VAGRHQVGVHAVEPRAEAVAPPASIAQRDGVKRAGSSVCPGVILARVNHVKRLLMAAIDERSGDQVGSDQLIQLALDALLGGVDTPALRQLAGLRRGEEPEAPCCRRRNGPSHGCGRARRATKIRPSPGRPSSGRRENRRQASARPDVGEMGAQSDHGQVSPAQSATRMGTGGLRAWVGRGRPACLADHRADRVLPRRPDRAGRRGLQVRALRA